MQPPYDPWKELFFVMSPILVFLGDIEVPRVFDIHADQVLHDLVQSTLFDLAIHQAFLVHRSDHLLHETDPDILLVLAYMKWSEVLVARNYQ